jgi:hypothetical protein
MASATIPSEAEIIDRVIMPENPDFSAEAARAILRLQFDRDSTKRIRQLLRKNNRGTISAEERIELERYLRVGQLLDLLQAKAHLRLQSPA